MGLDKLRLISKRGPSQEFLAELNEQRKLPQEQRRLDITVRNPHEAKITGATMCTVASKKRATPAFFVQMNYNVPGSGTVHALELNPNKPPAGLRTLSEILARVFGEDINEMKISRVDLNADIDLPVDYFRRTLRIPRKRKTVGFTSEIGNYTNRGLTGFYIGRSPSFLRVYDKREEMKQARVDITGLPPILTRLEWELRQHRCPVRYLVELPQLMDYRPFDPLQIIETDAAYDFHNDTESSIRRFTFDKLSEDYGRHDAIRILNRKRNYNRDYSALTSIDPKHVKERLHDSYLDGLQKFFANEQADANLPKGSLSVPVLQGYRGSALEN